MKNAKNTPAPWNVGEWVPCNGNDAVEVISENGEYIALVYTDIEAGPKNADLIAAAPEMLSMLEYVLELSNACEPFDDNDHELVAKLVRKIKGGDDGET